MKPANFPQRINSRREMALNNLVLDGAKYGWDARSSLERATLLDRLAPNARGVRTKKDRSTRASLRRT